MKKRLTLFLLIIFYPILINSISLVVPKYDTKCNDGKCIDGYFPTIYGNYRFITGNRVYLRSRPNVNSTIIKKLAITEQVLLIARDEKEVIFNGKKGHWAFVKSLKSDDKGWVFDYYVSYLSKFTRVKNWKIKRIEYYAGDLNSIIYCTKNGYFRCKLTGAYGLNKILKGIIAKCGNVIWFKKYKEDNFPLVFYLKGNKIYIEEYYRDINENLKIFFFK